MVDLLNEATEAERKSAMKEIPGLEELVKKQFPNESDDNKLFLMEFALYGLAEFSMLSKHTLERYMKLKNELEKSRSNNYFDIDYPPLPLIEGF